MSLAVISTLLSAKDEGACEGLRTRFPGMLQRQEVNLVWEQLLVRLRITGLNVVCPVSFI